MTQTDLERLAAEVLQHLADFINRSAARQVRRMRASWSQPA